MKVLGIRRSRVFSPHSEARDEAIFGGVARELTCRGYEVRQVDEDALLEVPEEKFVFSMARAVRVLDLLEQAERQCAVVVNPTAGIRHCARARMSHLLLENGLPSPRCWFLDLQEKDGPTVLADVSLPCWVKRGDACAQSEHDVCFVSSVRSLEEILQDFSRRGIRHAVINEHLAGDLVKFYGVAGTPFFHWYYPTRHGATGKFGLEVRNGEPQGYLFDFRALKQCCDQAADVLSVPVYGGDCIVSPEGQFKLIDFNDWPSYNHCLGDAIPAIADYLCNCFR